MKSVEKISTLVLIALCGIFFLWVAPTQIETVDYGRVGPRAFPSIAVGMMLVAVVLQLFFSTQDFTPNPLAITRIIIFIIVPLVFLWVIKAFGFEFGAPLLAAFIMLTVGERRWYWLLVGVVVLPVGFWLIVEQLLDRTLP